MIIRTLFSLTYRLEKTLLNKLTNKTPPFSPINSITLLSAIKLRLIAYTMHNNHDLALNSTT